MLSTIWWLSFPGLLLLTKINPIWSQIEAMERIINGRVIDIRDVPYQVALVARRGQKKRIICGGALIKPKIVLTAAHCTHVNDFEPRENLAILVGANYLNDPDGKIHLIDQVYKHPDFSFSGFDNDISVIMLKQTVDYNSNIGQIDIGKSDYRGGSIAQVSGWGLTEYGKPSKYLRTTDLIIERWNRCQDYFPGVLHPKITRNMICVKPGPQSTYFGDSGGPLVVDGELIGLVSFGRTVSPGKKITVFTRVKNFLDFIEGVTDTDTDGSIGSNGSGSGSSSEFLTTTSSKSAHTLPDFFQNLFNDHSIDFHIR